MIDHSIIPFTCVCVSRVKIIIDLLIFHSVHTIISSFAVLFPLKYKKTEENLVKVEKNLQVLLQYMNEDYSFGDYPGVADFRLVS